MGKVKNAWTFNELKWDTEFFGVSSSKTILHRALTLDEWNDLKTKFENSQFISIVNLNAEPINAQWIGQDTAAFLADVNIQFEKKLTVLEGKKKNITIHEALGKEHINEILEIADFQYSKFTEDPNLAKRNGDKLYHQWLINAFEKQGKFFALSENSNGEINGFLLFSYTANACVIELIAVSQKVTNGGIGSSLVKALEYEAFTKGFKLLKVGTQIRNMGAINFYQRIGCKQVECHQVYHLWNL